jgi:hypothetical protein
MHGHLCWVVKVAYLPKPLPVSLAGDVLQAANCLSVLKFWLKFWSIVNPNRVVFFYW